MTIDDHLPSGVLMQSKKKHAVRLTVVFLNNGKRSSKLTPIYSGCANLLTLSSQKCCRLKVCHNALERDLFLQIIKGGKTRRILPLL